ncbi:MAG TPA: S8 family peptidase [Bryobacteraceae bacterium]|nr:S8 family peptidase [Bryobacteraceae bacterium]
MNPEPERQRLQPSLDPRRADAAISRVEPPAAPASASGAGPAAPAPVSPAARRPAIVTRFQKVVRVLSVALLLGAAGLIVTGQDPQMDAPPPPPAVAAQAESVPNEIVVDLRDDITDGQIADLQRQFGIVLRYKSPLSVKHKLMVGTVDPARRDAVIEAMRHHPLVEAVDRQDIYRLQNRTFVPNDPNYKDQWHLKMIGMEEAWTYTKGYGATVAVIDSGVGFMQGNAYMRPQDFTEMKFRAGHDWVDGDDMPAAEDEHAHGTHVAGTIAESTDNGVLGAGVAPEAAIVPLRIADAQGRADTDNFAEALQYLADNPTNVANMSMGSPRPNQVLERALKMAYDKNVTLVCSAGNSPRGQPVLMYPAGYKECISVSAVGPSGLIAFYSHWGPTLDIAGPGGDQSQRDEDGVCQNTIVTERGRKYDGFVCLQGTSMAAPHVTGVAALLAAEGIKTPKEIRSILRKTATGGQPAATADHYGAGVLNAAKAVKSVARATRADYLRWGLSAAGILIAIVLGRNLRHPTDPMFFAHKVAIALAAGLLSPMLIEKIAGFGSLWNLVGHSVVLALLFLWAPPVDRSGVWQAGGFALGLMIHLALDADSLSVPLQVFPPWRIQIWLYANLAVGFLFLMGAIISRRKPVAQAGYA